MRTTFMTKATIAAATAWALAQAAGAHADQKLVGQRLAAQTTVYYDQYEPSQRQRLRRETCARDEDPIGPYCVKKCDKGYVPVANSKPVRCRSIEPLAPGVMPSAVRKQKGVQPPPPEGVQPLQKGTGQG